MELIVLQKLGLAALLGMIVGWERHLKKNPAGMRTHALVTLGTCAFTVIGLHVLAVSSSAIIPIIQAMIIGLATFRDAGELRLDKMLIQPFRGEAGAYALGRREA